jgi:hypothetical protein
MEFISNKEDLLTLITQWWAQLLSESKRNFSKDQIQNFQQTLAETIKTKILIHNFSLSVDYDPSEDLQAALFLAGLDPDSKHIFPNKTIMTVSQHFDMRTMKTIYIVNVEKDRYGPKKEPFHSIAQCCIALTN